MLLVSVALLALVFVAVMLVSGNNLSACVGPAVGSRILTKRFGAFLGAVGFSVGLLIQGAAMTRSVNILLPSPSQEMEAAALLVSILIFLFAYRFRVPMSLNMSLVGLLVGISLAQNLPLNATYVFEVVLTWVAVPLIAVASAFALMRALNHGWPKDFWRRLQIYKILLIALSFTTAYVTGANTLGLIVALGGFDLAAVLVAVAAVFVGCFFLAEGAIRRISQELYLMRYGNAAATLVTSTVLVEVATVFNIPLSITQTTSAAIFGTGLSYKTKLVSAKPFVKVVLGWVAAVLLSLGIGYLIG